MYACYNKKNFVYYNTYLKTSLILFKLLIKLNTYAILNINKTNYISYF